MTPTGIPSMAENTLKMRGRVTVERTCTIGDVKSSTLLQPGILAPEKQMLQFTLVEKLYAIPPDSKPYDIITNGARIFETHEPCPEKDFPKDIGKYRITIEKPIA